MANVNLVPMRPQTEPHSGGPALDKNAPFGQRRVSGGRGHDKTSATANRSADGGLEMSWVPSSSKRMGDGDVLVPDGHRHLSTRREGVTTFGAGMEKGGEEGTDDVREGERKGRTTRRKGVRSGSKNTFRRLEG